MAIVERCESAKLLIGFVTFNLYISQVVLGPGMHMTQNNVQSSFHTNYVDNEIRWFIKMINMWHKFDCPANATVEGHMYYICTFC